MPGIIFDLGQFGIRTQRCRVILVSTHLCTFKVKCSQHAGSLGVHVNGMSETVAPKAASGNPIKALVLVWKLLQVSISKELTGRTRLAPGMHPAIPFLFSFISNYLRKKKRKKVQRCMCQRSTT